MFRRIVAWFRSSRRISSATAIVAATFAWLSSLDARADDPPPAAKPPEVVRSRPRNQAPTPAPKLAANKPADSKKASDHEIELEERLRRMEEMNRKVLERYEELSKKYEDLSKRIDSPSDGEKEKRRDRDKASTTKPATIRSEKEAGRTANTAYQSRSAHESAGIGAQGTGGRTSPRERSGRLGELAPAPGAEVSTPSPRAAQGRDVATNPREAGGVGAQGTDARTSVREADAKPEVVRARVNFAEGLEFSSEDDEFRLSFHDLTQAEYRGFPRADQGTLKSQFFIPRQRWYITGRATKNVEFYTVINRGYGPLDLLDAFLTLSASDQLRLRVGRMKTPFSYEYFSIAEGDLIAPERSLWAGNLSGNRENGAMFIGNLAKKRIGYAAGIFNGPRRSFQDFNSDKDLYLYLNFRPFLTSTTFKPFKYLNVGGAVNGGFENNPLQPNAFRTANDQTNNSAAASLSPTFLTFNNNVTELGRRMAWDAHIVWFYNSLMLISEYGGGFQGYSTDGLHSTKVPFESFMVQGTYFITGERYTRRVNLIRPLRDFGFKKGKFGIGAIEVHSRFSELNIGRDIFAAGLADPNQWTNQAYIVDVGANWYLNYYTKIYLDWQHAVYGNPVTTGVPNRFMRTTNLFWLRFQVFF